jgi:hypothetical protein
MTNTKRFLIVLFAAVLFAAVAVALQATAAPTAHGAPVGSPGDCLPGQVYTGGSGGTPPGCQPFDCPDGQTISDALPECHDDGPALPDPCEPTDPAYDLAECPDVRRSLSEDPTPSTLPPADPNPYPAPYTVEGPPPAYPVQPPATSTGDGPVQGRPAVTG